MKSLHHFLSATVTACLLGAVAYAQQPTAPPSDETQPPAPIVRPKPTSPRPKPSSGVQETETQGAKPGTSTTPNTVIAIPKPRSPQAASGAAAATGPANLGSRPKPAPPSTPSANSTATQAPAAPARQFASGTAVVPFKRTTIVLDPSHGGVDGGSRITDSLQEKEVDLAFANRLGSLLTARGFTVQLTRDGDAATPPDSGTPLTLDDRAGIANHLHPVACLLIHSTGSGKGVHLYSSELTPVSLQPVTVPWLTAQASWVSASRVLQKQLGTALSRAEVPTVLSRASIRPLDSLACPALVLELAPNGSDKDSVNDAGYQQRVANAIASAMIFWQNQAQPPDREIPAAPILKPSATPPTPGDQP